MQRRMGRMGVGVDKGQPKLSSRGKKLPLIVTFADFYDVKKDSGEASGSDNHPK